MNMNTQQIIDNLSLPVGDYYAYKTTVEIPSIGVRPLILLVRGRNGTIVASALEGDKNWQMADGQIQIEQLTAPERVLGTGYLSQVLRCPHCLSDKLVKNGTIGGKRRWKCQSCRRYTSRPLGDQ